MACSNEQMNQWRLQRTAYLQDTVAIARDRDIDQRRSHAQQEMTHFLRSFLDGEIALKAFNTVFQQKTHTAWKVFHLQGMSGGLFLNKLVKHVPNDDTFGQLLRLLVRVPDELQSAQRQMQAFVQFLEGLIASGQVTRAQLQPARVPFFLSVWWHIQDPERWPIFYLNVRQALFAEPKNTQGIQDPVAFYFTYQEHFLALAHTLGVSSRELEHLASWQEGQKSNESDKATAQVTADAKGNTPHNPPQREACLRTTRPVTKPSNGSAVESGQSEASRGEPIASCRTHLQWLLAKLGQKVGCRVWIAGSDHRNVCQHERLGDLSLSSLPPLADAAFQPIICQIDVLWLLDNDIVAAYEIEQAHTDVSTSLLRLYDLGALFPNRAIQLCVVAPQNRFEKVRFELSRPTFRGHELRKPCALISEALLLQQEVHILRWANSTAVIEELIGRTKADLAQQ